MGRVKKADAGDAYIAKKEEAAKAKKAEDKADEKKEEKAENEEDKEEDSPAVKHLKEIDDKYLALEKEYEGEVQKLLVKFGKKQEPLLDERRTILTNAGEGTAPSTGTPALSGFWLKALQHHPAFEESLQDWDEPVLEFLTDIQRVHNEEDQHKGFTLKFCFRENPYFEHKELTKEYITESNPYCGEIDVKEIKATELVWKAGKDVTVERVAKKVKGGGAKKQKQKGKEKEEPRPSFFREFFRSMHPQMQLPQEALEEAGAMFDDDDADMEEQNAQLISYLMDNDHEVGTAFRDSIIPFAIRWYTGEAAPEDDDEDDDEDSEEEDFDDDEESDEEDSEEDERPKGKAKASAKKGGKAAAKAGAGDGKAQQEECKQQ